MKNTKKYQVLNEWQENALVRVNMLKERGVVDILDAIIAEEDIRANRECQLCNHRGRVVYSFTPHRG